MLWRHEAFHNQFDHRRSIHGNCHLYRRFVAPFSLFVKPCIVSITYTTVKTCMIQKNKMTYSLITAQEIVKWISLAWKLYKVEIVISYVIKTPHSEHLSNGEVLSLTGQICIKEKSQKGNELLKCVFNAYNLNHFIQNIWFLLQNKFL